MIAALLMTLSLAAPQDTPRPEDLSYMETYVCARLGRIGQETISKEGTPAPEDRDLYEDFATLERRATAALEPAKIREGDMLSPLHIEHGAAEELLAAMTQDQQYEAMNICGQVFQAGTD